MLGFAFTMWAFWIERADRQEDRINRAIVQLADGVGRVDAVNLLLRSEVSLPGLVAPNAYLPKVSLESAFLQTAEFPGATLSEANFRGADLTEADFRGADLRGADLSGANLEGANLEGARLIDANFTGAELRDVNFRGATFLSPDSTWYLRFKDSHNLCLANHLPDEIRSAHCDDQAEQTDQR